MPMKLPSNVTARRYVVVHAAASAYWISRSGPDLVLVTAPLNVDETISFGDRYLVDRAECYGGPRAHDALVQLLALLDIAAGSEVTAEGFEPLGVDGDPPQPTPKGPRRIVTSTDVPPLAVVDLESSSALLLLSALAKFYGDDMLDLVPEGMDGDDSQAFNPHAACFRLRCAGEPTTHRLMLKREGAWTLMTELRT